MASYFFDSSAIFKRYVAEVGTSWVLALTDSAAANDIYLAQVTGAEVVSALVRQAPPLPQMQLAQALMDFKTEFQKQFLRVAITDALMERAMDLSEKYRLRGYDSVQLADAVELHTVGKAVGISGLTFLSADVQLNTAAGVEGLAVDDPNAHP